MSSENTVSRLSTGNEFISVPEISTPTGGVETVGFMHSGFRACIELHGGEGDPLIEPVVEIEGQDVPPGEVDCELISYWIPRFTLRRAGVIATSTLFAPLDRRGFVCVLEIENTTDQEVRVTAGWKGCWESSCHTSKLSRPMSGLKCASLSRWREGVPVIEYRGHAPLFAMALAPQEVTPARIWDRQSGAAVTGLANEYLHVDGNAPVCYELTSSYVLGASEKVTLPLYVGFGVEEVSAVASAAELRLQGWQRAFASLQSWLDTHTIELDDDYLRRLLNTNSFYNYFFSAATTLDREEFVLTTARSSRNNSCGAYCDRDAMRWSLPAALQINWAQGHKMLIYAFTTQLANAGVASRFIDGIVLEPGLQLDQLCGPIRALHTYVQLTGDMSVLFDRRVQTGINVLQQVLGAQRHPEVRLFETLLLPSGEPSLYPYVCYSNVLVWRILNDLRDLYERIRDVDRSDEAGALAGQVRAAVLEHFVVPGPFGSMFARGVDLEGNFDLGDDPEGSLQLLTYLGFCTPEDATYKNTLAWIHSEHNPCFVRSGAFAAPAHSCGAGSSIISVVNDLLTSRKGEAIDFLRRAKLDDGIACETVDPDTGGVLSGKDFASGAGYLAFGLRLALNASPPPTAVVQQKRRLSETLYQPPPEVSQDSKKARL